MYYCCLPYDDCYVDGIFDIYLECINEYFLKQKKMRKRMSTFYLRDRETEEREQPGFHSQ